MLLEIRHKPIGKAGQGNYTTSISWGDISEFLGDKVIGKDLYLYAPAKGEGEPFYIEIR
jgi:hypothetical protein